MREVKSQHELPINEVVDMKHGFLKVAAASPAVRVADLAFNKESALRCIERAEAEGIALLVLPELHLTASTCGDLFYNDTLLVAAESALLHLCDETAGKNCLVVLGVPLRKDGKLYNCAAVLHDGAILGIVPKSVLPNHGEFHEARQFTSGAENCGDGQITLRGKAVPFGLDLLFCCEELPAFVLGVEIGADLWAPETRSTKLCLAGATVIANPSASTELVGSADYRRMLLRTTSARLLCGYVYANAGHGESTQDAVFSGHSMICENGDMLTEKPPFADSDMISTELDLQRLSFERRCNSLFRTCGGFRKITFHLPLRETKLTRPISPLPFVPADEAALRERTETILRMQSDGLMKRIAHIGCPKIVVGISGGLDSTLALLVMVHAMDQLRRPRTDILAISMPCFGTTNRTKSNAEKLCAQLGVSFKTVDISKAVLQHFADIGHDPAVTDPTFENSQARERTQVLMDAANQCGGIVVGTGDLSELALGWATYNGDHMSMYGVNASVPKTLIRYIIAQEMCNHGEKTANILRDILETPISPELLPAENGQIAQKTEDLVGPYALHDFFLYHLLRTGAGPERIFRLAKYAFAGTYDTKTILHWLKTFLRRFFAQQFKRSCLPDGAKIGTVSLSPRGDWHMPSDACGVLWQQEADALTEN